MVSKRKRRGKVTWFYMFNGPGSTRENRNIVQKWGFGTMKEAQDAEAVRRIEEQEKYELAKAGSGVAAAPPKTLGTLLEEFFQQHAEDKLAPTTIEGYRQKAAYLDPQLLAMPLVEITPLHLNREWTRLLKSGGHHRKTKEPRPLSRKTVRHVAGLVSPHLAEQGSGASSPPTRLSSASRRSPRSTGPLRSPWRSKTS